MKTEGMCIGGYWDGKQVWHWRDRVLVVPVPLKPTPITPSNTGHPDDAVEYNKQYYKPIEFHSNGNSVWFFVLDGLDGYDVLKLLMKRYQPCPMI